MSSETLGAACVSFQLWSQQLAHRLGVARVPKPPPPHAAAVRFPSQLTQDTKWLRRRPSSLIYEVDGWTGKHSTESPSRLLGGAESRNSVHKDQAAWAWAPWETWASGTWNRGGFVTWFPRSSQPGNLSLHPGPWEQKCSLPDPTSAFPCLPIHHDSAAAVSPKPTVREKEPFTRRLFILA